MDNDQLLIRTADIVTAHAANNAIKADQLPAFIAQAYEALSKLGVAPVEEAQPAEPAVPIRSSVKPDHITCLVCGARFKMIKRHLQAEHTLAPSEYRHLYGLPSTYPMVAPNYAQQRSDMALSRGLGRKATADPIEVELGSQSEPELEPEPEVPVKKAPRARKAPVSDKTSSSEANPAPEQTPNAETPALPEPPAKRVGRLKKAQPVEAPVAVEAGVEPAPEPMPAAEPMLAPEEAPAPEAEPAVKRTRTRKPKADTPPE